MGERVCAASSHGACCAVKYWVCNNLISPVAPYATGELTANNCDKDSTLIYESTPDTHECDGMCFSPTRALTEIFTLYGAYHQTGIPVGSVTPDVFIQEVARAMSSIALSCRQQMTSYFHLAAAAGIEPEKRVTYVASTYPGADTAVHCHAADLICPKTGRHRVSFYELVNKLCHVEKWKYPVKYNQFVPANSEDHDVNNRLVIEVTKRDKQPVTGNTETIVVFVDFFIDAARIFLTECPDCEAYDTPFDLDGAGASCDMQTAPNAA